MSRADGVTIFACKRDGSEARKCEYKLRGSKAGQLCGRPATIRLNRKDYCRAHGQMMEQDKPNLIQAERT